MKRLTKWEETLTLKGWTVQCYELVSSTMDIARNELSKGLSMPALVLAKNQIAGRGRQGRSWLAAEEGFYGTFVLGEASESAALEGFSLAVGVALQKVFASFRAETFLKWPNDIVSADGRKICGVLIEVIPQTTFTPLIGIGINIRNAPMSEAAALNELAMPPPDLFSLSSALMPALDGCWKAFMAGGFTRFRSAWLAAAYRIGAEVRLENGSSAIFGSFEGVDEHGALLIKDDSGDLRAISSGTLRYADDTLH